MSPLLLHDFHAARGATFLDLNGSEAAASYGPRGPEYQALTRDAALLDSSFRGRVCVLGADREKFLHGQVTNDVLRLKSGQGCYAALVSAKGKIESDLYIYKLKDELLLDFEPGLTARVIDRLNRYVIAEDVQIVDVSPHYGVLSVYGLHAAELLQRISLPLSPPETPLTWNASGEIYVMSNPRYHVPAFDLFVPSAELQKMAEALEDAGRGLGARWSGFNTLETIRIENGVPRYGCDMNESTLPQEAELQDRAISFAKGCYIGQEVIARIRTYGQVAKALRMLRLPGETALPAAGTKLFLSGKEVGYVTSATHSPKYQSTVALGYVRKEVNRIGTVLQVASETQSPAEIIAPA